LSERLSFLSIRIFILFSGGVDNGPSWSTELSAASLSKAKNSCFLHWYILGETNNGLNNKADVQQQLGRIKERTESENPEQTPSFL
jgi:hypothetical protein